MKSFIKKIIGKLTYKLLLTLSEEHLAFIYNRFYNSANNTALKKILEKYSINSTVKIGDRSLIYGTGEIVIGERTYIGRDCYIQADKPASIKIGAYCAIAHNIHIRTSDFKQKINFIDAFNDINVNKNIEIGDYVWIGANVYICSGVKIGNNVIIGANSVVTKDIPENAVAGGTPAKILFFKNEKYLNE